MKTLATVDCPYCGKLTDPSLDGCPHCGGYIKKKVKGARRALKKTRPHCPSCKGAVDSGDIICVACGTNLLTGQKIADAPQLHEVASDPIDPAKLFAGVIGLCVLVLIGAGLYLATSNPVKRAQKLIRNAQYPEAQELLMKSVQSDPENEVAYAELGQLQRRATQYEEAATSFKQALALNPSNASAGLLAVLSLQETQRPNVLAEQIGLLQTVTENNPENAQAWYLLGMAYGTHGDTEEQIIALEQVTTLAPSMESAELGLGIAQTLQGNYPVANTHLAFVSSPEHSAHAQASLGYIAHYQQNYEESAGLFNQALSADTLTIPRQANMQIAKIRIQLGDFHPAELLLKQILEEDPANALGRYLLGLTIHAQGRANEALTQYQLLIRADNGYEGEAAIQVASLQLVLNHIDEAQRAMSVARRAKLFTPTYYTVQGRLYMANESPDQARQAFTTALKMDPSYAPAYMERGLYYIAQSNFKAGLEDLKRYLNLLGPNMQGTKARDIRMLANQLHSTVNN